MAAFLRRLVLLVVALGVATALLVGAVPVVVLVLGGLVLLAALPPAHRVHVYYHRPPGSYWQ